MTKATKMESNTSSLESKVKTDNPSNTDTIAKKQAWTIVVPMCGEAFCNVTADTPEEAMGIIREKYGKIRAYTSQLSDDNIEVMTHTFPVIDLTNDGYGDFYKGELEENRLVVTNQNTGVTEIMNGLREDL